MTLDFNNLHSAEVEKNSESRLQLLAVEKYRSTSWLQSACLTIQTHAHMQALWILSWWKKAYLRTFHHEQNKKVVACVRSRYNVFDWY